MNYSIPASGFVWGLESNHVRYLRAKCVLIIEWTEGRMSYVALPWNKEWRERVIAGFAVRNGGRL